MFSIGIVGLPNVGKSSLFKALTRERVQIANYPFTTIDPHKGVVKVDDPQLPKVAAIAGSRKIVPVAVEFVDIAGLVRGAHEGAGLGNQFLSHIREVDGIVEVVRAFGAKDIVHTEGEPDPVRDILLIQTELALADISVVMKALQNAESGARSDERRATVRRHALEKIRKMLEEKERVSWRELRQEEREAVKDLQLLTAKPFIIVLNVSEDEIDDRSHLEELVARIVEGTDLGLTEKDILTISLKLETELAEMSSEEVVRYKRELGITEDALEKMIRRGYEILDLATFFTANENEAHAWEIQRGARAIEAAAKVHSDFMEKFIRAEVINAGELIKIGSYAEARQKGKIRVEGKDYVVQDRDVIEFKI